MIKKQFYNVDICFQTPQSYFTIVLVIEPQPCVGEYINSKSI